VARRIAAALGVALLVLVLAVTPLSATFQPGYFDLRLVAGPFGNSVAVTLEDDTGLVMGFAPVETKPYADSGTTRSLSISVDGDSDDSAIWLQFVAVADGYRITAMPTQFARNALGMGREDGFVLLLRAPIDASKVTYAGKGFGNLD
jgi:hypothetical protein